MSTTRIYVENGRHRIADTELSVADVLALLASGMSVTAVANCLPELSEDDIKACISYALRNNLQGARS